MNRKVKWLKYNRKVVTFKVNYYNAPTNKLIIVTFNILFIQPEVIIYNKYKGVIEL